MAIVTGGAVGRADQVVLLMRFEAVVGDRDIVRAILDVQRPVVALLDLHIFDRQQIVGHGRVGEHICGRSTHSSNR